MPFIAGMRIKSYTFVLRYSYYTALRLNSDKIKSARRFNIESAVTIQTTEFRTMLLETIRRCPLKWWNKRSNSWNKLATESRRLKPCLVRVCTERCRRRGRDPV